MLEYIIEIVGYVAIDSQEDRNKYYLKYEGINYFSDHNYNNLLGLMNNYNKYMNGISNPYYLEKQTIESISIRNIQSY